MYTETFRCNGDMGEQNDIKIFILCKYVLLWLWYWHVLGISYMVDNNVKHEREKCIES